MTVKRYKTTAPKNGIELARFKHGDEVWHLYVLQDTRRLRYVNWKLASLDYVDHKAAYWFGWDMKTRQLVPGRVRDLFRLRDYRPALHVAVDAAIWNLIDDLGDPRLAPADWHVTTLDTSLLQSPAIPGAGDSAGDCRGFPASDQSPVSLAYPPVSQGSPDTGLGESARDKNTGDPDGDLL